MGAGWLLESAEQPRRWPLTGSNEHAPALLREADPMAAGRCGRLLPDVAQPHRIARAGSGDGRRRLRPRELAADDAYRGTDGREHRPPGSVCADSQHQTVAGDEPVGLIKSSAGLEPATTGATLLALAALALELLDQHAPP